MNITFLIGNGFDLNAGLETTYSAFLKDYLSHTAEDDERIKYFKQVILKDTEMWSNAELAFGAATKQFETDGYTAEDFCECHEDFCIKLANYLTEQEQRINYSSLQELLRKGFAQGLQNYKKGFREAENDVLKNGENAVSGAYTFNIITFNYTALIGICHQYLEKSANPLLGSRAVNGSKYQNACGKLIYAHGSVNRDMVLGVNDVSQIAAPSLFDEYDDIYINELIKQKTNEINGWNTDKKAYELLKSSDLIYIYGMSLGKTDQLWWERICTLMAQKPHLHVIIHRHDAPEEGLIIRRFLEFTNRVKREFVAYSQMEGAKKKNLEDRIHIDRTNIFKELKNIVNNPANSAQKEGIA